MSKLWTAEKKLELQGVLLRNIDRGKSLKERLGVHKSLTSGKLIQSGTFCLDHDVLQHQINIEKSKRESEKEEKRNRFEKKTKRKTRADNLRMGNISKLSNQDLSFLVTYKKHKNDEDLPNARKSTLQIRYATTRNRPSPNVTPYASDEDPEAEGVNTNVMDSVRITSTPATNNTQQLNTPTPRNGDLMSTPVTTTADNTQQLNTHLPRKGDLMSTLAGAAAEIERTPRGLTRDSGAGTSLIVFDEEGDGEDDSFNL